MALVVSLVCRDPRGPVWADLVRSFELMSRPHGHEFESLRLMVLAETQVGH